VVNPTGHRTSAGIPRGGGGGGGGGAGGGGPPPKPRPSLGGELGWPNFGPHQHIGWGGPSTGPAPLCIVRVSLCQRVSRCGPAAVVGRGCWVFRRGRLIIINRSSVVETVLYMRSALMYVRIGSFMLGCSVVYSLCSIRGYYMLHYMLQNLG